MKKLCMEFGFLSFTVADLEFQDGKPIRMLGDPKIQCTFLKSKKPNSLCCNEV